MMSLFQASSVGLVLSLLMCVGCGHFGTDLKASDQCFCKLKGAIDECSCNVDTVDHFNNIKIYPRLRSLLLKDYFRFYKVNLRKECPFWTDDSRCAIRYCHVEPCLEKNIPPGLKGNQGKRTFQNSMAERYTEEIQSTGTGCNSDHNEKLGYLNTTISAATYEEFARWKAYDDAIDNYCVTTDDDVGSEYVDLSFNPERYTGYKGKSAHRIWNNIYMENCFRPKDSFYAYIESSKLNGMCLEKRVFYRVISGLHASINVHLCSKFLQSVAERILPLVGLPVEKSCFGAVSPEGSWGPNLAEFRRRFDPATTNNEGPQWLRNLYFLYLLELRALEKAAPYLKREEYFTGNAAEDVEVRSAMGDFLGVVGTFPSHFDETCMFAGGGRQTRKLKEEFRQHFRNISRIMDCVGCEKCKLWGKLQIHGLGTALKILFSGKFDNIDLIHTKHKFQLQRGEIVALLNAFGRLSTSILELENFRAMMR